MEVSGNLGEKVPMVEVVLSCHENKFYPLTSHFENCNEFDFQTDGNYKLELRQSYLVLD